MLEPVEESLWAEQVHPTRGQLDGEGQAIESRDDPRDRGGVAVVEHEIVPNGGGPFDEERHRLTGRQCFERRCRRVGERERSDQVVVLAGEVQRHAARSEDRQPRGRIHQPAHGGRRLDDLFDVVQNEEERPIPQVADQRVEHVRVGILMHAE